VLMTAQSKGKVLKLSKLMGALILAGLVQGAQDVLGPLRGQHSGVRSPFH